MGYSQRVDPKSTTGMPRLARKLEVGELDRTIRNIEETRVRQGRVVNRLSSIFEPVPIGVGRIAADNRWVMANMALCRVLGYERMELLTKTVNEMTYYDDWLQEAKLLKDMQSGVRDSYSVDKRYLCRNGSLLWVNETSSVVKNNAGSFLHRISLIEVNEFKRTEDLFRLTIESLPIGMVLVDHLGKIVLVNSRTEAIFDYHRNEMLGRPIDILIPELLRKRDSDCVRPIFSYLQVQRTRSERDIYGRRKNGTLFPVKIGVNAIDTPRGAWMLGSIVEISEHRPVDARVFNEKRSFKVLPRDPRLLPVD